MIQMWMGMIFVYIGASLFSLALETQSFIAGTSLTAALTASDTTITVSSTTNFPSSGERGFIGEEEFSWTGTTATTFTGVTRGINDTEATAHSSGAEVLGEVGGLLNLGLNFDVLSFSESNSALGNVGDFFIGIVQVAGILAGLLAKIVMWDYSWLEGNMIILKFFMYVLSFGIILTTFMMFKSS